MTDDVFTLSATQLLHAYRTRQLSPLEVTRGVLARIAQCEPQVNAFTLVDESTALEAARASEARWQRGQPMGLLDGVPTTIKDLILTQGWPTRRGSLSVDPQGPWEEDAPVTARLREHGAILIGKTTTPEYGWKGVTDSPLSGITRNPWNTDMTPGGSSGGAAVAAALGMGALHIGTDGGGSIRIPAGFTGIVGLKPSFGRVPAYPLSPFGTVSHVGPMTRSVADAALMLTVLAEADPRDWHALPPDGRDYRIGLEDGIAGLRVAYSRDLGFAGVVDPEVATLVDAAVATLASLGAWVEPVELDLRGARDVFDHHWYCGAATALATLEASHREAMDPGLQAVAEAGTNIPLMDYLAAVQRRGQLGQQLCLFHQQYDLLVTPTLPITAFPAGQELADPQTQQRWPDWTPFSYPFNLSQQPAISVPCGLTSQGLPVGLQLVGPRYADALVLRAARAFESCCPSRLPELDR